MTVAPDIRKEWIEWENSTGDTTCNIIKSQAHNSRLLTATNPARILNISKAAAYQRIQQKEIPSV
jgi:hypothetical protein